MIGSAELITELSGNVKLGLVTSAKKDRVSKIMQSLNLMDIFDITVTSEDITRPKPAPDPYIYALNRLQIDNRFCVAIEDSETGIASAVQAGIRVVGVPNKYTLGMDFSSANLVVESLQDLSLTALKAIVTREY